MFKKAILSSVCSALIIELSIGSSVAAFNQIPNIPNPSEQSEKFQLNKAIGSLLIHPQIEALENSKDEKEFSLHLSMNDPIVDQNPFFMEGQAWKKTTASSAEAVTFVENADHIVIQPRGLAKSLTIRAALRPLLATDEYLYFSARENGDGIYVVPYQKLIASSVTQAHVPVFFIPLPGEGWSGDVGAIELPGQDMIAVKNADGGQLPIALTDIRQIVKIESMNLFFATAQAMQGAFDKLKANPAEGDRVRAAMETAFKGISKNGAPQSSEAFLAYANELSAGIERVLGKGELSLPRGSTAGKGILYTGFDLAHPERGSVVFGKNSSQYSWLDKLIQNIGIQQAHALDPEVAHFLYQTARVLGVCGVVFIGGIVARYTVLKQKINDRIAAGKLKGDLKVARRTPFDIFAHSMTMLSQIPSVWSAQALRYTLDRIGVSENAGVRRLFNSTFGFALKTNDRTPVNTKTLIQGVVVLGGVDTAMVAFQGYFLMGWIADGMAWVFPSMIPRVNAAYHSGDAAVSLYLMLSTVQNMIAWISSGAYSYAHDIQTTKTAEGERKIADAMKAEGKNPSLTQYKGEYDRRVKAYVREAMLKNGLPGDDDFLFDANSVYGNAVEAIGYEAPKNADPHASFKASERPGLTAGALKAAIRNAEAALEKDSGSLAKKEAVRLLKKIQADFSVVRGFIQDPSRYGTRSGLIEVARSLKRVRTELTSLTDQNATEVAAPESWVAQSAEGAQLAAEGFRSAFFDKLEVKPKKKNPVLSAIGRAITYPTRAIGAAYENWQIRRAITRAKEKFIQKTGSGLNEVLIEEASQNPSADKKLWDRLLQDELTTAMGLYPELAEAEFYEAVDAQANEKLNQRLASDAEFKAKIDAMSVKDRNQALALQKAALFSEVYVDETAVKETIEPLSPMQPGILQKFRQKNWVKNSKVANMTARMVEGAFSNSRYQLGLAAKIKRVIPLLEDITQGNMVVFRNLPVSATVAYWWSWAIWGSAYPRMTWFISSVLLAGTTIRAGWMVTQRMTANMGIKPGGTTMGMINYGIIGSFATMWGFFFFPMYKNDIVTGINHVLQNAGQICNTVMHAIGF